MAGPGWRRAERKGRRGEVGPWKKKRVELVEEIWPKERGFYFPFPFLVSILIPNFLNQAK